MTTAEQGPAGGAGERGSVTDAGSTTFLPPEPAPRAWGGAAPARWGNRAGATLLDNLLIGIPLTIVVLAFGLEDTAVGDLLRTVIVPVISVVYAALLLAYHHGQTLGKQATDVRVLTADGAPVGLGRSVGRELVKAIFGVTFVLYVIDVLWPLWQSENRALHDLVAGTRVVGGGGA